MSSFNATPRTLHPGTSYVVALFFSMVALNVALLPLGRTAVGAASDQPAVTEAAQPRRPAAVDRVAASATPGTDHRAIAPDAVSVGDVETVEMSIAAYERLPQ